MESCHRVINVTGKCLRPVPQVGDNERQQRRREQQIERLIEQQHDRRLHSFDKPGAATIELIEGPAPTEDSSVPPDPAE